MQIFEKVREKIKESGVKQRWLAQQIGVADSTISLYLKGDAKVSATTEEKIVELVFPVLENTILPQVENVVEKG